MSECGHTISEYGSDYNVITCYDRSINKYMCEETISY